MFVSFLLDLNDSKQGLARRTHSQCPEDNFIFKISCLDSVGKRVMLKILGKKKIPIFTYNYL